MLNFDSTVKVKPRGNRMRIREVSEKVGISERMLRYYEQEGLLKPVRDENGYRNYSQGDLDAAYGIAALVSVGLEIEQIRVIAPCLQEVPAGSVPALKACPGVARTLRQRLGDLDTRIAQLVAVREAVAGQLASLPGESISRW